MIVSENVKTKISSYMKQEYDIRIKKRTGIKVIIKNDHQLEHFSRKMGSFSAIKSALAGSAVLPVGQNPQFCHIFLAAQCPSS
jgi:hypothetical protein